MPRALALLALFLGVISLLSCDTDLNAPHPGRVVVLYSSADPMVVRPIIEAFETTYKVRVKWAGDTEATKTTGLATRLLDEHRREDVQADVWWSSEPFWTIRLADEGVLEPWISLAAERSIPGGWPDHLRPANQTWYGFAQRARVFVYNTERIDASDAPRTLGALTDPRLRGRIGIADPVFGTTRGHMGAVASLAGTTAYSEWMAALAANGVRRYDGNMSVVRAVASGEIDVGLTDTDDVWNGQRNGWPVAHVYEPLGTPPSIDHGMGAMVIPNTVGLVKGRPHQEDAKLLLDFLLSPECERIIAESDSHNVPVNPTVAQEFEQYAFPDAMPVALPDVAASVERALEIARPLLGG